MQFNLVRVVLVLASIAVSIPSSFAVGPGLQPFEEGKGTIGLTCTQPSGHQVAAMPSADAALAACRSSSNLAGCLNQVRDTARREFADCAHGVREQWFAEALREGSGVHPRIWEYVDGSAEYSLEMSGLYSAVIQGRTAARRRPAR